LWTAAHVAANPAGGFTVSYTNLPGASTASLRIHVVDADGGVLDQTIINAYAIA
jgi:sulfate adenylyltransferase subunit 1 (EFTu-like GTPase family)